MAVDRYKIPEENVNTKTKKLPKPPYKSDFGIESEYEPTANVKNLTKLFTEGKFQFTSRYVRADVNLVNSINNTFRIDNAKLDDKYTVPLSKDFDIYIKGLLLPFDIYTVAQSGEDVIITFRPGELDYDTFCADDVVVFGKFTEVNIGETTMYLLTEETNYLITEDNKLLII